MQIWTLNLHCHYSQRRPENTASRDWGALSLHTCQNEERWNTVKNLFLFLDCYKNLGDYFRWAHPQCKHLKLRWIMTLMNFVLPQPILGAYIPLFLLFFHYFNNLLSGLISLKDWPQPCRWWGHLNSLGLPYTEIIMIFHKTKSFMSLTNSEIPQ